ncbi:hypothetical protein MUG10_05530 [Xanthomonas prunicola]|uniref:Uncharacterized protein n=2 Tax=Xanthomonas prunicola TaxID=2053930 RepID=A0A9Q9IZZ6_9XANT|nr:hypothetical protein [Xanthomonas prunicola]USJ01647.1 hypothetical protein MUG10_05530 [Xanthomonas prunicola]UXA50131.1 hypothetical protein M0D44_06275 [Xanthomonas prunicola]UXA58436.1 hypothetical protein M0D47_06310 [Xanthomonas prunicola]UXA66647.1 hypothetical protein M0D43_06525 [Xanthomonas prunicola]UXA70135.1 hypothetical protein M0D46_03335 [Xanthomonas prunicola]
MTITGADVAGTTALALRMSKSSIASVAWMPGEQGRMRAMNREKTENRDNSYRARAARDAQILREMVSSDAHLDTRLGRLPHDEFPLTPTRGSLPPLPPVRPAATPAAYPTEDDLMKLHHLAAAAIMPLAAATTAGCSKGIDVGNDGATGHLNPHPVKRYEVIATSHAPGPWDSFKGAYIGYDVINTKCVPMIPLIGEQHVPNAGLDVPMVQVDDHTWKGYFYRDALVDEDYFNLGVCHWDVTSVGVSAIGKGVKFGWGGLLDELLHENIGKSYFKKSSYGDPSLVPYGALELNPNDPEVLQSPDAYFPVTITVKEAKS